MQTAKMELYDFTVVKGHQVASGRANDPRFPVGTINAQASHFKALGLDISEFYPATINAEFKSKSITLNQHDYFFQQVKWHKYIPAEDFKFWRCNLLKDDTEFSALIYQPQLDTKTEHIQPLNQLEILAPYIKNINYGDLLTLKINKQVITLSEFS